MNKKEIWEKLSMIRREERQERMELLRDHHEKFQLLRNDLYKECEESGDHEWIVVANGHPHFLTGEWPMNCRYCGKGRPIGWTYENTQER